jgi:hypothetical protein
VEFHDHAPKESVICEWWRRLNGRLV